jgi:hypothetical protein
MPSNTARSPTSLVKSGNKASRCDARSIAARSEKCFRADFREHLHEFLLLASIARKQLTSNSSHWDFFYGSSFRVGSAPSLCFLLQSHIGQRSMLCVLSKVGRPLLKHQRRAYFRVCKPSAADPRRSQGRPRECKRLGSNPQLPRRSCSVQAEAVLEKG